MRYIRHQPGYSEASAVQRRFLRGMARSIGITPRRLKKQVHRTVGYSATRVHLQMMEGIALHARYAMTLTYAEFVKAAGYDEHRSAWAGPGMGWVDPLSPATGER